MALGISLAKKLRMGPHPIQLGRSLTSFTSSPHSLWCIPLGKLGRDVSWEESC